MTRATADRPGRRAERERVGISASTVPPRRPVGTFPDVEIEPRPEVPPRSITDADRSAAAEVLQAAAGDGRLTLAEFSDRVGAVWAAETAEQLESVTAGLQAAPAVGSTRTVSTVWNFVGDQKRTGRWRLPARLRVFCLLGNVELDLRSVVCAEDVVEIRAVSLFGDIRVDVPDGVEVELGGFDLLGDRELGLTPVPRIPGTPLLRISIFSLMGDATVRSTSAGPGVPGWRRWLLGEKSPPIPPPPPRPPLPPS